MVTVTGIYKYLDATEIIDSDHPDVRAFSLEKAGDAVSSIERAVRLYYAVRDGIRYDPYYPFHLPSFYKASTVLKIRRGFCVPKVSLLCAAARACGIPARAGFATVKNHLATRQLLDFMGSDLFVFHGFAELFLDGRWVKATPAFNRELCERFGVPPLEFDGRHDSIFQVCAEGQGRFMEYLEFYGSYEDIPVGAIVEGFKRAYGEERVRLWIENYEKYGTTRGRPSDAEEPFPQ